MTGPAVLSSGEAGVSSRACAGRVVSAMLAGAGSVFAYAPFELYPLALVSIAILVGMASRAQGVRATAVLGFAWGLGAFLAGVSWLYIALNRYGGMPMPFAALAILLLSAYLALFPALVLGLYARFAGGGILKRAALFAGLWCASELLRGWLFTGFPWLAIGYSQSAPSPLAGFLPILGVYGVGALLALCAALLGLTHWRNGRAAGLSLVVITLVVGTGAVLRPVHWTEPAGEPIEVALIQTNVEQSLKWRPETLVEQLESNARLALAQRADLVVMPETTLPLLADRLPEGYLEELASQMRGRGSDLVLGVFLRDSAGHIYNGALNVGRSPSQTYAKQHLVPFGEYSPPLFGWFYRLADIPMSDQTRGKPDQPPLRLGDQRVAINICYEDLFGRELIRSLPEATLMLNMSNLAWYGDSFAQPQHLQIARVRALETGRPMLRSTNTGMTAVVQPDGSVTDALPAFEQGILAASVRGYQGLTPYARWGDAVALLLALVAIAVSVAPKLRRKTCRGA